MTLLKDSLHTPCLPQLVAQVVAIRSNITMVVAAMVRVMMEKMMMTMMDVAVVPVMIMKIVAVWGRGV